MDSISVTENALVNCAKILKEMETRFQDLTLTYEKTLLILINELDDNFRGEIDRFIKDMQKSNVKVKNFANDNTSALKSRISVLAEYECCEYRRIRLG